MSLIKAHSTWLIFSAIFKVFLCFGRLLLKCWKSCNFHAFPIAAKHRFNDFIALRGLNPVSFVHCQGFLRNLSMSLHTNRWHMAYFLCNFQSFPLLWAASAIYFLSLGFSAIFSVFLCFGRLLPKMLKKLYFPGFLRILSMSLIKADGTWFIFPANFIFSFALGFCQTAEKVAVSILSMGFFAIFLFLLCVGALHVGQLLKQLQFRCFSHCRKTSFLWFHCAKGTKPSFFRPLPRFPAEFEHVTTYKQMAYGLFSLQFSRFSFALGGFCHFLPFNGFLCNFVNFPLLWAASAKTAEKVVLSRFPSDSEHVTNKSKWHMAYFLCNVQGFPLLWAASAKMLKKLQFRCLFPIAAKHHFYDFIALRGPNPVSFVHCQGFLGNLSMSLHTNRWHMAYFLCNFQSFPLLWAASAKMLKKLQFPCFSHCSKASLLWFHCAKGTKPSFFRPLPRFPAEFEHVTTYKQMAYGLFSLQFSRFSFALGGFCHFLPFNGFLCNFLCFPLLWAASAKNAEKVVISRFPSDSEHVTNKSRWDMVYFPCKFHFFLCFGRLLPNCWKSRSFHPFNGFLCHFLVLTLRWGAPSGTTAEKVAISMLFPLQESLTFMISLR